MAFRTRVDLYALADLVLDAEDLGDVARRVVDSAVEAGGSDNATVVLVRRALGPANDVSK